jgi:hypothetical protein
MRSRARARATTLSSDDFVATVRAAFLKSRKWTAAEIARLKMEHAATIEPARKLVAETFALERQLSDIVNAAYGLTPEEVALMWRTAPPRLPLNPASELERMGLAN